MHHISEDTQDTRFIRQLEAFQANGYQFDDMHALKQGTQHEAFDNYLEGIRQGHRHGYFEIPTGVGKTAIFLSLIKNYLASEESQPEGKRVLVVVPNITLVHQTAHAFAKFMPEIASRVEASDDGHSIIDWDASDIGVQYRKLKHADKKPRVLITTYASLIRDKDNQVYNPEEFGLVVYDEGHSITASESSKAVNKFTEALQLAVTATPNYSDNKQVAKKLPHRYYGLSLREAIHRGDLCDVRPIVLRTNYTVDQQRVEEYFRANNGRQLSDAQLQVLFNVEARNRAVIDTYLAGRDPDSGERFLGQQGLIFGAGVEHADDMVRQFHSALAEPRFDAIRRWLESENLEVAAAVHSQAEGAWLRSGLLTDGNGHPLANRHHEGQREWYSEEEVKNLHEQGKILMLISDKKLREGYDCPKDSIVIDMVDRFSVVDATQRLGRGLRLDPDDEGKPLEEHKVCTPINLVDTNTYDLYRDRQHMLPIYAAEILEGAEYRRPVRRRTRRFVHDIPEADAALAHGAFEVISDPEVVRAHNYRQQREKTTAPPAREGWMSANAITKSRGGNAQTLLANILALKDTKREQLIQEGKSVEDVERIVAEQWVEWAKSSKGQAAWFISPEGLDELIKQGKAKAEPVPAAPPAREGWMSSSHIRRTYGGSDLTHTTNVKRFRDEKTENLIQEGKSKEAAEQEVSDKWVQWAKPHKGQATWFISPEGIQELIQKGKIAVDRDPLPPTGWLSGAAIREVLRGDASRHVANIQIFRDQKITQLVQEGKSKDEAMQEVEDKWVRWGRSKTASSTWYISPEGLQELTRQEIPFAKEGWMSGKALGKQYGGDSRPFVVNIQALRDEKLEELARVGISKEEAGREIVEKWVEWARGRNGIEAWFISPEGVQVLIQQGKIKPQTDNLGQDTETTLNTEHAEQTESWAGQVDKNNGNPDKWRSR